MSREARPGTAVGRTAVDRHSSERMVLLTVMLGTMLAPLNSTMIAVALPDVMDEFDVGIASAGWLVTAYLAAMASLQPVAGKIGDRFGRRRLVLGGLILFGFTSVAAALAPNLWLLLAFRVLQAVAGALIVPNGGALMRDAVPEARRGRSFGLVGAGIALAAGLGPPIGGALVEAADWRAIFAINVVLILPALVLGWRCLPHAESRSRESKFDVPGAVLLPLLLVVGALLLMSVGREARVVELVGGLPGGLTIALVIAVLFAVQELRHPDSVFQPRLFRLRAFAAANVSIGFGNLAMYTLLLTVPLLLARRDGASSLETGTVLAALSASMLVLAPAGGRLTDRLGRRLPTTAGLALSVVGAALIAMEGSEIGLTALVIGLILAGSGLSLATPGLQTTAVESVDREQTGAASGVYSTSRYIGSIVGSAIMAGLLGADNGDTSGVGAVFLVVVVASVVATVASLGLRARPASERRNAEAVGSTSKKL